ncbi:GAF and ANTAR domain-containing protein [Phycicoccus avicenniae]|uniref:GAF and ANTAR domain-containing protein n=1 Tax=Phycicoccus avicenniae TaxID=2828860 RepID=UPI003D29846A
MFDPTRDTAPAPDPWSPLLGQLRERLAHDGRLQPERLVALAAEVLPHSHHAGITLIRRDRGPRTIAATDELPRAVDTLQYSVGEGPCLDAATGHDVVRSPHLVADARWPTFVTRCAKEQGVASMLAVRLDLSGGDRGALNFYAPSPGAFDDLDVGVSSILAPYVALSLEQTLRAGDVANLERALDSSRLIGIAVGILMARHQVDRHTGFELLRTASQHLNVKLRDLAADVADTGELPTISPRSPGTAARAT